MIARDDVIVTFTTSTAVFHLKIACRVGRRSATEIMEILKTVVHDGVSVSCIIQRSRFAPDLLRPREGLTTIVPFEMQSAAAAPQKKKPGRPRKNWDSAKKVA